MGSPHWADALRGCGVPPCSVDHARCLAPRVLSGSSAVSRSHEVWSRDAQRCAVVVHESQAGGRLRGGLGDCGAFGALEPASAYPEQPPRSTRRNALPVELIDGSFLMGHKYLACAVV